MGEAGSAPGTSHPAPTGTSRVLPGLPFAAKSFPEASPSSVSSGGFEAMLIFGAVFWGKEKKKSLWQD